MLFSSIYTVIHAFTITYIDNTIDIGIKNINIKKHEIWINCHIKSISFDKKSIKKTIIASIFRLFFNGKIPVLRNFDTINNPQRKCQNNSKQKNGRLMLSDVHNSVCYGVHIRQIKNVVFRYLKRFFCLISFCNFENLFLLWKCLLSRVQNFPSIINSFIIVSLPTA